MKDNAQQPGQEVDLDIRQQLFALAESDYRDFSSKLLPDVENILGVRLPKLRSLAKSLAVDHKKGLSMVGDIYFEEVMLQGMIIGYAKADIESVLSYVSDFIPKINNWSVCDSFCSSLKITNRNPDRVWQFLQGYLYSEQEFEVRFAVVLLLHYYIEQPYLEQVFCCFEQIRQHGYYADMAVAWAVSICYIRFPEQTHCYLKNCSLNDFVFNKSLQKITESRRISTEVKKQIRSMKR